MSEERDVTAAAVASAGEAAELTRTAVLAVEAALASAELQPSGRPFPVDAYLCAQLQKLTTRAVAACRLPLLALPDEIILSIGHHAVSSSHLHAALSLFQACHRTHAMTGIRDAVAAAIAGELEVNDFDRRARALADMRSMGPSLLCRHASAVATLLTSGQWKERLSAVQALAALEPPAMALHAQAIVGKLQDSDEDVRLSAVWAVRRMQGPSSLSAELASRLTDTHHRVRSAVRQLVCELEPAAVARSSGVILNAIVPTLRAGIARQATTDALQILDLLDPVEVMHALGWSAGERCASLVGLPRTGNEDLKLGDVGLVVGPASNGSEPRLRVAVSFPCGTHNLAVRETALTELQTRKLTAQ